MHKYSYTYLFSQRFCLVVFLLHVTGIPPKAKLNSQASKHLTWTAWNQYHDAAVSDEVSGTARIVEAAAAST
ncbi:hypothetical protein J3F84DRAFT_365869 [Trichoderma pleuroticola]